MNYCSLTDWRERSLPDLQLELDVNQIRGQGQTEQRHQDTDEVYQESRRFEPSRFQQPARVAVAQPAGKGQHDAAKDGDGSEPDRDAHGPDRVAFELQELANGDGEAANGKAALEILKEYEPDLMVLDFGMPDQNGAEVANIAKKQIPKLKILFVSGYADTSLIEKAVGSASLLRKPFRPLDLSAAVRASIEKS